MSVLCEIREIKQIHIVYVIYESFQSRILHLLSLFTFRAVLNLMASIYLDVCERCCKQTQHFQLKCLPRFILLQYLIECTEKIWWYPIRKQYVCDIVFHGSHLLFYLRSFQKWTNIDSKYRINIYADIA